MNIRTSDFGPQASDLRSLTSGLHKFEIWQHAGGCLWLKSKVRPRRQVYFNLVPTGTSSINEARIGFPPSGEAATIIPFDSNPRNFLGARFTTITTLRPISVSGE